MGAYFQQTVLSVVYRYRNLRKKSLVDVSRVKFTKHAIAKFELVRHYGFEISNKQVIETVLNPERLDKRDNQYFAIKIINSKHALRGFTKRGKAI
jgi:hypothetical protein